MMTFIICFLLALLFVGLLFAAPESTFFVTILVVVTLAFQEAAKSFSW